MMLFWLSFLFHSCLAADQLILPVPNSAPSNAARLDPAPLGISFEFFTFPSYFTNVSATEPCLRNFKDLTGIWPPIRIGGTTQNMLTDRFRRDRADYAQSLKAHVSYSVPTPQDAPKVLTYGPSLAILAAKYLGSVVLGLNRGHDDIKIAIASAKHAKEVMNNLLAFELGNEPEYYPKDGQVIASRNSPWNQHSDAKSQANWQVALGKALNQSSGIVQASNSLQSPSAWGAATLIKEQNATAMSYVKLFSHHNYPGAKNIAELMGHARMVKNIAQFDSDIKAARSIGKEYVFGETNSVTGGGAAAVSPSFGAALWIADYVLRATSAGVKRLYFHHGTIEKCAYCFWDRHTMKSPYYGAFFATAALARGSRIVPLDAGNGPIGAYAVYAGSGNISKIAVINTEYLEGGQKGKTIVLTGLLSRIVIVKRLTAPSPSVTGGKGVFFGGRQFKDGTCGTIGNEKLEKSDITGQAFTLNVRASEAALLSFED